MDPPTCVRGAPEREREREGGGGGGGGERASTHTHTQTTILLVSHSCTLSQFRRTQTHAHTHMYNSHTHIQHTQHTHTHHTYLVSFPDPFCARARNLKLGGAGKGSGKSSRPATVGMLERLEWNAVSVLCIRPTVLYSVARRRRIPEKVRNSLNSYEWLRARKQRRNVEKKNSYEASTER